MAANELLVYSLFEKTAPGQPLENAAPFIDLGLALQSNVFCTFLKPLQATPHATGSECVCAALRIRQRMPDT